MFLSHLHSPILVQNWCILMHCSGLHSHFPDVLCLWLSHLCDPADYVSLRKHHLFTRNLSISGVPQPVSEAQVNPPICDVFYHHSSLVKFQAPGILFYLKKNCWTAFSVCFHAISFLSAWFSQMNVLTDDPATFCLLCQSIIAHKLCGGQTDPTAGVFCCCNFGSVHQQRGF